MSRVDGWVAITVCGRRAHTAEALIGGSVPAPIPSL